MWYKDAEEFKSANGYEIDGIWYPRVTKILEIKSKPALEAFFKEVESYAEVQEVKNKSAAEGTLVHEAIQGMLTGEPVEVSPEIAPAVEEFERFNKTRGIIFHKEYVERQIKSSRHRYAGTVDALATVDGKFGVLDIKTSSGFYPEYNLQTAAYTLALQEFALKRELSLPRDVQTRWILRIDQGRTCMSCSSYMREKGGRKKIKNGTVKTRSVCADDAHAWGPREGKVELKEFPYMLHDMKAFIAAKTLWEWENNYWLRKISYEK